MSTTEIPQEQETEPGWISIMRQKARAYDKILPQLQSDLAVLRADLDESHPSYGLWKESYGNRVKAGEASWDPQQVKADAELYGIVKPEMIDYSADIATARRIEAASSEAVEIDPKDSARQRMAHARNMDDFIASYRAQGGVVVED